MTWTPTEIEYRTATGEDNQLLVGSGDLKLFSDNPQAYYRGYRDPPTPAMAIGIALHELCETHQHIAPHSLGTVQRISKQQALLNLYEAQRPNSLSMSIPNGRQVIVRNKSKALGKRAGKAWTEAVDRHGIQNLILDHEMITAWELWRRLYRPLNEQDELAAKIIADSDHEVAHRWTDYPGSGIECRCRWDLADNTLPRRGASFYDIKTKSGPLPTPSQWGNYCAEYGLLEQRALYALGWMARHHCSLPLGGWLVASKSKPYSWGVYDCSIDDLESAIVRVKQQLRRLAACRAAMHDDSPAKAWKTTDQASKKPLMTVVPAWYRLG